MSHALRDALLRQLEIGWMLTQYHLGSLTTEECLWRPAPKGLHVVRGEDGVWRADWPDHEGYDLGPPSVAWLTWHLGMWWSMVVDHSFGTAATTRESVHWPGDAEAVRRWIEELHDRWRGAIEKLSDDELQGHERTRWPITERPFVDVVAWANLELMKNAAEIGYARFLYGVRA
jgi:hypothetical protein